MIMKKLKILILCLCINIIIAPKLLNGINQMNKKNLKQSGSSWLDQVKKAAARQKTGTFLATDKTRRPIALEWTITDVCSPDFAPLMKSICNLVVEAFTPVEVDFLKANGNVESQKEYCQAFEPIFATGPMASEWQLFKKGLSEGNWPVVEEKMKLVLQTIQEMDYSNFGKENVHCFVLAKEPKAAKVLGYATFYLTPEFPDGNVKISGIAVDTYKQNRGLGKLIASSVFNIIPSVKRIFLTTRPTNETALVAYKKWGFVIDKNPIKEPYAGRWIHLEYRTLETDILQKLARSWKQ